MAVVTISHQMGAGGPEIGMKLGQKLGYRYVDQELVLDVARRDGVAEDKLADPDEWKPTLSERDDAEKAGRMRYLYEVDLADPMLYDVTVSTERLGYDAVVEMIETCVRRPEMGTTDVARRNVAARALASRVQVALAINADTRRY